MLGSESCIHPMVQILCSQPILKMEGQAKKNKTIAWLAVRL